MNLRGTTFGAAGDAHRPTWWAWIAAKRHRPDNRGRRHCVGVAWCLGSARWTPHVGSDVPSTGRGRGVGGWHCIVTSGICLTILSGAAR